MGWCRKRKRAVIAYSPVEEGLLTTENHVVIGRTKKRLDHWRKQLGLTRSRRHLRRVAGASELPGPLIHLLFQDRTVVASENRRCPQQQGEANDPHWACPQKL